MASEAKKLKKKLDSLMVTRYFKNGVTGITVHCEDKTFLDIIIDKDDKINFSTGTYDDSGADEEGYDIKYHDDDAK